MCKIGGNKSFFTDYGRVCTTCGSMALFIAAIYLVISILLRCYIHTDHLPFFESVPSYIPAISFSICGLSTVACAWKPYRNVILLKLTGFLAFCNAGLASVITIAVIFIQFKNFQAMKQDGCVNPPANLDTCHCVIYPYSPAFPQEKTIIFENSSDCTSGIWVLNGCLLLIVPTSIAAIFLSVFLVRLLDELTET